MCEKVVKKKSKITHVKKQATDNVKVLDNQA